jgi:hypothetical protein
MVDKTFEDAWNKDPAAALVEAVRACENGKRLLADFATKGRAEDKERRHGSRG